MNKKHDTKKWKELYESGLTYQQIGDKYGVDFRTVHYHLKKMGVQGRRPNYYHSGPNNVFWKEGVVVEKKDGYTSYRLIYSPDHPHRNKQNKVREHRLVMEAHLGHYLKPGEVVDHIDGNGLNNDINNLRLYSSNAAHLAATKKGHVPRWSSEGKERMRRAVRTSATVREKAAWQGNRNKVLQLFSKYPPGSSIPETDVVALRKLRHLLQGRNSKNDSFRNERVDLLWQIRIFLKTCRRPSRRIPSPIRTIV